MKIIKKGKNPKEFDYEGKCTACGCVVQVSKNEIQTTQDSLAVGAPAYKFVVCPMEFCTNKIYVASINEVVSIEEKK